MTLRRDARGQSVIKTHRAQRSFGDGLIAAEVADLHEVWMRQADRVLEDPQIVAAVYEALARRHPKSRSRGRLGTPAEVVLRLLVLKHMRNWSYAVLEREVRANLVYRDFTRVGGAKMPDAKTLGRWGVALGPAGIKEVHGRMLEIARAARGKVPNRAKMAQAYGKLLDTTARVVGQAKRFAGEIERGVKRAINPRKQAVLEGLRTKL